MDKLDIDPEAILGTLSFWKRIWHPQHWSTWYISKRNGKIIWQLQKWCLFTVKTKHQMYNLWETQAVIHTLRMTCEWLDVKTTILTRDSFRVVEMPYNNCSYSAHFFSPKHGHTANHVIDYLQREAFPETDFRKVHIEIPKVKNPRSYSEKLIANLSTTVHPRIRSKTDSNSQWTWDEWNIWLTKWSSPSRFRRMHIYIGHQTKDKIRDWRKRYQSGSCHYHVRISFSDFLTFVFWYVFRELRSVSYTPFEEPVHVVVDRPFVLILREKNFGTNLFAGVIKNLENTEQKLWAWWNKE